MELRSPLFCLKWVCFLIFPSDLENRFDINQWGVPILNQKVFSFPRNRAMWPCSPYVHMPTARLHKPTRIHFLFLSIDFSQVLTIRKTAMRRFAPGALRLRRLTWLRPKLKKNIHHRCLQHYVFRPIEQSWPLSFSPIVGRAGELLQDWSLCIFLRPYLCPKDLYFSMRSSIRFFPQKVLKLYIWHSWFVVLDLVHSPTFKTDYAIFFSSL